jgi:26S proteasome regulatory subunit N1
VNGKKDDDKIIDCMPSASPHVDGKLDADFFILAAEDLSEEDQQLKNELDMLVERLTVWQSTMLAINSSPRTLLTYGY